MMKGKIANLMSKNVICIAADVPFTDACRLFSNLHFHHLPVKDEHGKFLGMFSATDAIFALNNQLVDRSVASEDEINDLIKIKDVMTSDILFTLNIDDELKEAIKMFRWQNINSILILENKKIAGILTSTDVLSAYRSLLSSQEATSG